MTRPARSWLAIALVLALGVLALLAYFVRPDWRRRLGRPSNSAPALHFVDVTDSANIQFKHISGASSHKLLPETMGSGVAVLDYDRDGRPDLYFVNSMLWPDQLWPLDDQYEGRLYRNRGDGTFENVTDRCGLWGEGFGMGVAVGDIDNDGWPDMLVTGIGGQRLYRNVGGKEFKDITKQSGLNPVDQPTLGSQAFLRETRPLSFPSSATFLDYDGDGRLDLFVCNYLTWSPALDLGVKAILPGGGRAYVPPQQFKGAQCSLYRNVDGTRFVDVSESAGIHVNEPAGPVGKALGVVVCDPDNDGWPDLVVANDTVRNFFFHNVPDPKGGRRFEETGLFSGLAYADGRPRGGMGIDTAELQPGAYAVLVANFSSEPNSLFERTGTDPLRFADVAPEVGLAAISRAPMKFGALFFDADRDGRPDLFTANGHLEPDIAAAQPGQTYAQPAHLYWNTGERKGLFSPVGGDAFPPMVGRGCAYLDFDGDGDLDLVVTANNGPARLFRNDTPGANHHVRLTLTGGPGTNRDAIGATIEVEAGGVVRRAFVTPTHGYLSQSERTVTIGLGAATTVDRVTARWPGAAGRTQEWRGLSADRTYELVDGVPEAR